MRRPRLDLSRFLFGLMFLAGISLVGVMLGTRPGPSLESGEAPPHADAPPTRAEAAAPPLPTPRPAVGSPPLSPGASPARREEAAPWEERIRNLLTDDKISVTQASRDLFALAADADGTEEQRLEALQHGLNLVADSDYLQDVVPLLTRPDLPRSLSEQLWMDLHNRPADLSAPAAEAVASVADHPFSAPARELAEFFRNANAPVN